MDQALSKYFDGKLITDRYLKLIESDNSNLYNKITNKHINTTHWNDVPQLKHMTAHHLSCYLQALVPGYCWDDFYKFCFVRNPFERLLSIYSFHVQKIPDVFPQAVAAGNFRNWLIAGGTGSACESMKQFLVNNQGDKIVDFIGRYESLEADWDKVLKHLNLKGVTLGKVEFTATKHDAWQLVYTPEMYEIVMANPVWREDIDYFNYSINLN